MTRASLCLVALAAILASAGAAPAATPGVNGHLLVASGHRHEMTLFAMQPRNNGDRLLLNYGTDQGATYSPDGTRIAFMNNYDGDYEICVMNADGTGVEQLTKNSAVDAYPSWSPDGSKIAFTSNRDGDLDIYVMNADGARQRQLTHNNVDDIVMDWQSLHVLRAPTVKALTSHGTPGKRIALHFKAFDNSGRASIAITVFVGKRPYW